MRETRLTTLEALPRMLQTIASLRGAPARRRRRSGHGARSTLVDRGGGSRPGSSPRSSASSSSPTGSDSNAAPIVIGISLSPHGDFSDPSPAAKQGLRALGRHGQRERRRQRPPREAQDRGRREQPEPGRDELPEPDHADKVDLVVGPFSTLLTGPAAQWRTATATRSSSRPAAARDLRAHSTTSSSCSRPPSTAATVRRTTSSRCRRPTGPRPPPTPSSTTPSRRRSPTACRSSSRPWASRPSTRRSTRRRPATSRRWSRRWWRRSPTCRGRHAVRGRLQPGQGAGAAQLQPQVPVPLERRELARRVPEQGGQEQRRRHLQLRRLVPDLEGQRQPRVRRRLHQEVRLHRARHRLDVGRGVRRRAADPGVAKKTGTVDNQTIINGSTAAPGRAWRATSRGTPTGPAGK